MQLPVQNSWGIGELWTLIPVVPNGQRYRKLSRSVGSVGCRSLGCNAQYRFTSADQAKRPGFCANCRAPAVEGLIFQVATHWTTLVGDRRLFVKWPQVLRLSR
jgi:hypothetical protein